MVDEDGLGIRIFNDKCNAKQYIQNRPEMKIISVEKNIYQEALDEVGECLL